MNDVRGSIEILQRPCEYKRPSHVRTGHLLDSEHASTARMTHTEWRHTV